MSTQGPILREDERQNNEVCLKNNDENKKEDVHKYAQHMLSSINELNGATVNDRILARIYIFKNQGVQLNDIVEKDLKPAKYSDKEICDALRSLPEEALSENEREYVKYMKSKQIIREEKRFYRSKESEVNAAIDRLWKAKYKIYDIARALKEQGYSKELIITVFAECGRNFLENDAKNIMDLYAGAGESVFRTFAAMFGVEGYANNIKDFEYKADRLLKLLKQSNYFEKIEVKDILSMLIPNCPCKLNKESTSVIIKVLLNNGFTGEEIKKAKFLLINTSFFNRHLEVDRKSILANGSDMFCKSYFEDYITETGINFVFDNNRNICYEKYLVAEKGGEYWRKAPYFCLDPMCVDAEVFNMQKDNPYVPLTMPQGDPDVPLQPISYPQVNPDVPLQPMPVSIPQGDLYEQSQQIFPPPFDSSSISDEISLLDNPYADIPDLPSKKDDDSDAVSKLASDTINSMLSNILSNMDDSNTSKNMEQFNMEPISIVPETRRKPNLSMNMNLGSVDIKPTAKNLSMSTNKVLKDIPPETKETSTNVDAKKVESAKELILKLVGTGITNGVINLLVANGYTKEEINQAIKDLSNILKDDLISKLNSDLNN